MILSVAATFLTQCNLPGCEETLIGLRGKSRVKQARQGDVNICCMEGAPGTGKSSLALMISQAMENLLNMRHNSWWESGRQNSCWKTVIFYLYYRQSTLHREHISWTDEKRKSSKRTQNNSFEYINSFKNRSGSGRPNSLSNYTKHMNEVEITYHHILPPVQEPPFHQQDFFWGTQI